MARGYLDFDVALCTEGEGVIARVLDSPAGAGSVPFVLPFGPVELAHFMTAVGPPRLASRRLVPVAARVLDVTDYGRRLGAALLAGDVDRLFRQSLTAAKEQDRDLLFRLHLGGAPELEPVPWEYLYYERLGRFLTLSTQTPIVRVLDSLDTPGPVTVTAPLRVLVMISSPTDLPQLEVERESQLLMATTQDLVDSGQLELVFLPEATLSALQRALLDRFHVFHFIGHGGFEAAAGEGVLALERGDGTAHRVDGARLGTLLHDARGLQLAVLNACEGARTSGRDAFSGVAQALVRQGLPAVVAMQAEISDRAALVFSHEFYSFLTRGLPVDRTICEVRKAMATSDEAAEWGTAVLLRSGSGQPFEMSVAAGSAVPQREQRWSALYDAARESMGQGATATAVPLLEQLVAERPDYADATSLLERLRERDPAAHPTAPPAAGPALAPTHAPPSTPPPAPTLPRPTRPGRRGRPRWPGIVRAVVIVVVIAAGWIGWRTLPTLLQKATPLVEIACGAPAPTSPPATSFVVGCAPIAPTVDGDFDDWRSVPAHAVSAVVDDRGGRQPSLSGTWQSLWDKDALHLHVVVRDATRVPVDRNRPGTFWTGDGVSFEFGPDARRLAPSATVRSGHDVHVMFGVVDDGNLGALAAVNQAAKGVFAAGALTPGIDVARRSTADGYELEARVPWDVLGLTIPPPRGAVVAMNVNISDAAATGQLGEMLSTNPKRVSAVQSHPAQWQTVLLSDGG